MGEPLDGWVTRLLGRPESRTPCRHAFVEAASTPQESVQRPGELPHQFVPSMLDRRGLGRHEAGVFHVEPLQDGCVVGELRDVVVDRRTDRINRKLAQPWMPSTTASGQSASRASMAGS